MCNLVLHILIFVFLPKKNDYKLRHFINVMSDNFEKENNNTYQYLFLENELKTYSRVNQAVLGFSFITFIFLISKIVLYIFYIEKEKDIIYFIITIKIMFEFINWSMALSIADKVNKMRKDDEIKACTNSIKSGIVKVIVLITINFILCVIEVILVYISDVNTEIRYISKYVEIKKFDNNDLSERNQIINVKKKITLKEIKCENFEIKKDKNSNNNELIKLYKELQSKYEEISELKSLNPYNLKKGEQLYSIVFLSSDYHIVNNFSLICKNTDPFSKIEQTLYDKFPLLKETDNNFNLVNGIVVNRYKTLEENNIRSGDVIQLCKLNF